MRRLIVSTAVALFVIALNADGFAAQNLPIPITECGEIAQPGKYVLENDLTLPESEQGNGVGGTCLVISASHVKIDLNGLTIGLECLPHTYCPSDLGAMGGTGIDITTGADHVSISNGTVDDYVYGIVGEADHLSVTKMNLRAVVGLTLDDVSRSSFTDIAYEGADIDYHSANGPILYLNGGGKNVFNNLSGQVGSDLGGPNGIEVVNSNDNLISGVSLENVSCGGTDIQLSDESRSNIVTGNNLFDDCGSGIQLQMGSTHNAIVGNTVVVASPPDVYAMFDENPDCRKDLWMNNTFSNIFAAGEVSASPANCIH